MDAPPENDFCSICHGDYHVACQANCGHWFCGGCILQHWDHSGALHPCKCPLCRRVITMLVPSESARGQYGADVVEILQRIQRYNRLYGEQTTGLLQKLQDLPFLLRRLMREIMDPRRSLPMLIQARVYLAVALSVIYVISPVDLIPEGLMGIFGMIDDLIVVFICFLHVGALYRAVLLGRHGGHHD